MKKTYFIMIYIVMVSAFTAFGQSVVSGSTDADNNGNPEPLPAVSASETVPADPAAHTDTGAAEAEVPSAPEANAENEPSVAPKTVVIPEQSNKTQERKDVVEPVEKTNRRGVLNVNSAHSPCIRALSSRRPQPIIWSLCRIF